MRRRAVALVVALLATACETAPIVAPAGDAPRVTALVGGRVQTAGLSYAQILASLTTAPARRFGAARAGRLTRGADADVVVVNGAPERDIRALADVRYTIRAGRVIYRKT